MQAQTTSPRYLIGDADHRHIEDRRMRLQPVFDLARVHVEAAADDQFLAPADDVDEALVVYEAQIAGQEVTLLVEGLAVSPG